MRSAYQLFRQAYDLQLNSVIPLRQTRVRVPDHWFVMDREAHKQQYDQRNAPSEALLDAAAAMREPTHN